jgi:hypothetical protein
VNTLQNETEVHFASFTRQWEADLKAVSCALALHKRKFLVSYRRIVSLQAWRTTLLDMRLSTDSLAFFLEAQNDALTSHVLARLGSWRTALKALRGCIENVLACLYYMDHPVELSLWQKHRHRLGFGEYIAYFRAHPAVERLPENVTGLAELTKEFATLSAAVHGSASSFRMTADGRIPRLWTEHAAQLGAWLTRESRSLLAVNLILLTMFRGELEGAKLSNLRKAISLGVPEQRHRDIRQHLGVRLFRQ